MICQRVAKSDKRFCSTVAAQNGGSQNPCKFSILFFIHIGSRRVFVSGITDHPHSQWMAQQARNLTIHVNEAGMEATHLIRDGDKKFTEQFDESVESCGTKVVRLPAASPNMNAYASCCTSWAA